MLRFMNTLTPQDCSMMLMMNCIATEGTWVMKNRGKFELEDITAMLFGCVEGDNLASMCVRVPTLNMQHDELLPNSKSPWRI